MAVTAISPSAVRLDVGDVWLSTILVVSDSTGMPTAADVTAKLTDPSASDSSPAVSAVALGIYQVAPTIDLAGRWITTVTVDGHGVVTLAAEAIGVVTAGGMPDVAEAADYLGPAAGSWTPETIGNALTAERAAQASVCVIPATYPADLREALLRRVGANLARRQAGALPAPQGDAEINPATPVFDPEVRRLEGPWRRLLVR